MKYIKRIAVCVMSAAVCASLLTACAESSSKSAESAESSASKSETMHTLYVRDEFKSSEVTVTFENTSSGETEKVKMGKLSESDDYFLFSCEGNAALYNRAYITHDDSELLGVAFNKYVSGWSISSYGIVPFTEGEEPVESVDFKTETFDYNGNKKEVYIWTPKGYNQSSKEKYSTVYLLDGESKLSPDFSYGASYGCWYAPVSVTSMMAQSDNKAIIVAISNSEETRYDELVPDIGKIAEEEYGKLTKKKGADLARFMAETLVPYVQKNYNVYTDALHTSVTGASLGGLETFYITMEYPEVFGTAGAQSPSFWTYSDDTWKKYLSEKDFGKNTPFIYLYTGPSGGDTDPYVTDMYNRMIDMGYPADKAALHFNDFGGHHVNYWRSYFSEFLSAMVFQSVEPLQTKK